MRATLQVVAHVLGPVQRRQHVAARGDVELAPGGAALRRPLRSDAAGRPPCCPRAARAPMSMPSHSSTSATSVLSVNSRSASRSVSDAVDLLRQREVTAAQAGADAHDRDAELGRRERERQRAVGVTRRARRATAAARAASARRRRARGRCARRRSRCHRRRAPRCAGARRGRGPRPPSAPGPISRATVCGTPRALSAATTAARRTASEREPTACSTPPVVGALPAGTPTSTWRVRIVLSEASFMRSPRAYDAACDS